MQTSIQGALQKMGSNFLVAAFVPAMAFIVISSIVFYPIMPPVVKFNIYGDRSQFIQFSFIALIFVTVLGFTLYSLSTYIYKAYEGYSFILEKNNFLRRSFLKRQKHRYKKNEANRVWIRKELARIDQKIEREIEKTYGTDWREKRLDRYIERRKRLEDLQYSFASELNENFPPSIDLILPTRFGNILRAAEMYPGIKYSIDSVPLWGRLVHLIPNESMEKLDEANNQCLFLLNASLLALAFSLLCLCASAYQGLMLWANFRNTQLLYFIVFDHEPNIYQERIGIYIVVALLSIMVSWFFYEASLLNVSQFGNMIRTAYDLYRFNLLEALHLELPLTYKAEKKIWQKISNFMIGNDQWKPLDLIEKQQEYIPSPLDDFRYIHDESKKQKTQDKPEINWRERGIG